jgi:hypothetical protein
MLETGMKRSGWRLKIIPPLLGIAAAIVVAGCYVGPGYDDGGYYDGGPEWDGGVVVVGGGDYHDHWGDHHDNVFRNGGGSREGDRGRSSMGFRSGGGGGGRGGGGGHR